ncbi:MAG: hypothetical protein ACRDTU_21875 [Micromonosporaceae bacterium]
MTVIDPDDQVGRIAVHPAHRLFGSLAASGQHHTPRREASL